MPVRVIRLNTALSSNDDRQKVQQTPSRRRTEFRFPSEMSHVSRIRRDWKRV